MLMICSSDACFLHFKDMESAKITCLFRYFYADCSDENVRIYESFSGEFHPTICVRFLQIFVLRYCICSR